MHQPMKSYGKQLPSLQKQVHCTTKCIHLVPPKRNNKISLDLLNFHPNPSQLPTNIINYLISKNLQKSLVWFLLNPPNYPLLSNTSIIFEPTSSLKPYRPFQIPSITDKIITWKGVSLKGGIFSVASHGWLTAYIEMILMGICTKKIEYTKTFGWEFSIK